MFAYRHGFSVEPHGYAKISAARAGLRSSPVFTGQRSAHIGGALFRGALCLPQLVDCCRQLRRRGLELQGKIGRLLAQAPDQTTELFGLLAYCCVYCVVHWPGR